jgi:tetratricopeptide (TPR) repeat protein
MGTAALNSRDLDLALVSARAVLAASPDGDLANEAGALLGRALLARGDTDAALAELAARVKAGASLDLELEYAGLLAAVERPSEALAAIDGMTARYGAEAEVRRLRALVSLNAGDLKTAWEGFSALLNDGEFADESHFYLAEIAAKQERYDQALQLLGRVGNGPFLLPAQDAISRIAEASGDAKSAQQLLKRLAERYPQLAFQADRYRAALMQRLGQDQPALDLLSQMLFYRPDDAGLLLSRGALLEKMGQLDAAVTDMRAAVKLLPDSALTLNALGYTLANRTARYDEAYALIRRAIEREPGSAAILDSYGWVLCRQRKLPEARSYLQLAYSQFPDPEVAAHLGEAMWQQGDRDPARRLWEEALEGDPASQPLKDTMARFIK